MGKKKEEQEVIERTMLIQEGVLYEEVYDPEEHKYWFVSYTNGKPSYCEHVDGIMPQTGAEHLKGVIKLPETATEYTDTKELLNDIQTYIRTYLDVDPHYEKIASYYVLLSWLYDRVSTVPYLRALGDTGSGKSRFLNVIGGVCYKTMKIAGTASPAATFRIIEKWRGTLVIDEADRKKSDTTDDVVKILNCGYEKDNPVLKCDKEDPKKLETHDVYGPKIIGTRESFYDKALEARCFTEVMRETLREDIPPLLMDRFYNDQMKIRNKCLRFRLVNYWNPVHEIKDYSFLKGVEPRLKQVITPLLQIFADDKPIFDDLVGFIQEYRKEIIEERSETIEGRIVLTIKELLTSLSDVSSKDILNELNKDVPEGGRKMSAQFVGKKLKSLGLKTKLKRVDGKPSRYIEFEPSHWGNLLGRYDPESVTSVTSVTNVSCTPTLSDFQEGY